MFTVIAVPLSRISSGSSTTTASWRLTAALAARWLASRRDVTLPMPAVIDVPGG
jgi:hypothetical protein